MLIILARIFCSVNFGLDGEGVGGGVGAHIAAHIDLHREAFGLNYARLFTFYFLKARRAVMGPAKRGPIWAG